MMKYFLTFILFSLSYLCLAQDTINCQKCFLTFAYPDSLNVIDTLPKPYFYSKDTIIRFTMVSSVLKPYSKIESLIADIERNFSISDSLLTMVNIDTLSLDSSLMGKRYKLILNNQKGNINSCVFIVYVKNRGIVNIFSFAKLNDELDEINTRANAVLNSIDYFEPN